MASLRPTNPYCRFQSTQTSRRRVAYTIGADMLEPDPEQRRRQLDPSQQSRLDRDADQLYNRLLPSPDSQEKRLRVVDKLKEIIRHEWPESNAKVVVFGSSGNLLCTSKSDVDICITMRGLETVCVLADLLSKRGMQKVTCVHAKSVPIVKIWDPELQMACDLNVNNHVAIKNTTLVRTYMEIDSRVRTLAMIIKFWTKQRIINEASGGALSSYTWTLLIIFFLQNREAPILPVIGIRDERGQPKNNFEDEMRQNVRFGQNNKESVGHLLFHFFRYYGYELDYESAVMSVREGRLLTKREKNWHLATNNRLCVEEPFNVERNLGNTADDTAVRGLHVEIRQAFSRLAAGEDLATRVCEKFEFPVEEYRTIFERPQPQPRPVLSRSASQSGRGNRNSTGARLHKQRGDNRGGVSARRSSSAAAFGSNSNLGIGSPHIVAPSADYFFQPPRPGTSPEELAQLRQRLFAEEQQLKYQQLLMSHVQRQASSSQPRGPASSMPHQQRSMLSMPSPGLRPAEPMPSSAPLYQGMFPTVPSYDSPVSMSHSSSQQGTSTNPSSPMLQAATPARRGLQRAPPLSPGAQMRSQSQPARPMPAQYVQPVSARQHFGMPQFFMQHPTRTTQVGGAQIPKLIYGYQIGVDHFGGPLVVPVEAPPREYLGYGIGAASQYPTLASEHNSSTFAANDDIMRQWRQSAYGDRAPAIVGSSQGRHRSPSPINLSRDYEDRGLKSAPINASFPSQQGGEPRPRPAEDPGPIIVNGSYNSSYTSRSNDPGIQPSDQRRVSDSERPQRSRPNFFADDSDTEAESQAPTSQRYSWISGLSLRQTPASNSNGPTSLQTSPAVSNQKPSTEQPTAPAQNTHNRTNHDRDRPTLSETSSLPRNGVQASAPSTSSRSAATAASRSNITPLDLSMPPLPDRKKDATNSAALLSPVQETRTPSPSSNRKFDSAGRRHSQINGNHHQQPWGHGHAAHQPPPPPQQQQQAHSHGHAHNRGGSVDTGLKFSATLAAGRKEGKENLVGTSGSSGGVAPLLARQSGTGAPSSAPSTSNSWQQAGRKNNKKVRQGQGNQAGGNDVPMGFGEKRSRGEPLPANEADRKGG